MLILFIPHYWLSPSWQMVWWPSGRETNGGPPSRAAPWSHFDVFISIRLSPQKVVSKGSTARMLWDIMINTPDVLQLGPSSVHFTIKFYDASRHPAACIHGDSISSAIPFRSAPPGTHFPFPLTSFKRQWSSIITLLLGQNLRNVRSRKVFFRGNFILLDIEKWFHGTQ